MLPKAVRAALTFFLIQALPDTRSTAHAKAEMECAALTTEAIKHGHFPHGRWPWRGELP